MAMCQAKLPAQRLDASIALFKASRVTAVPALQQIEAHFYAGLRKAGIPEQRKCTAKSHVRFWPQAAVVRWRPERGPSAH
jgi:hypothetical protein